MAYQNNNTALLLFSRTSGEECRAKNFLPFQNHSQNKKIAQKIIEHSISLANRSGLPYFVWDESLQQGNNFGERISHAVEDVFKKGFEKIIIIGNDCITLNTDQIKSAVTALQTYESVIAPTNKGGAYLIGISKNIFDKKSFTDVRWQTALVTIDLQKLYASLSVFEMPVMDDINDFNDLKKQAFQLSPIHSIRIFLQSIIASISKYIFLSEYFISKLSIRYLFRIKAPPAFYFSL